MGAKTDLEQFEKALAWLRAGNDTGNSLHEAFDEMLLEMDGSDFELAILTLDMAQLTPFLVIWRRELIGAINSYQEVALMATPLDFAEGE